MHPKRVANPDAPRPKHPKKDWDELVEAAWAAGWWCERANTNYFKCWPPDGGRMVPLPATPSGSRTLLNKRLALRRSGLEI